MSELEEFSTPILLIIFKRPDTTREVFNSIRKIRPNKLYIAADGPRSHKIGESELCNETRKIISLIDWKCDVYTLFQDNNLGCANAVRQAITWFFSYEEEGIILEDDCVPSTSFYLFCQKMLNIYKNDNQIMMISGYNPVSKQLSHPKSHYFSRWANIWGWATWKDRWELYNISFKGWDSYRPIFLKDKYFDNISEFRELYLYEFDLNSLSSDSSAWSWAWNYTLFSTDGLCVVPSSNLINNIGEVGVHSNGRKTSLLNLETTEIDLTKLESQTDVVADKEYDEIRITHRIHDNKPLYLCLWVCTILRKMSLMPKQIKYHPLFIGEWMKREIFK
ncbi:hypothetical protein [Methanocorpusculum parvum]|uniref:Nucleotide-diphospho-sugar transferase n=1 Tax=Methanocorpusculum parvum TaxID=2193 RepID=A0AAX0Q922_9EURY|nr:hypothetical protein [Methanocorpusculum parvum]PAV09382.1 hypothetical protein ASJ83_07870 [Methanocorpusculum parvum]